MEFEKIFKGTVDIPNPIDFCTNEDHQLIDDLRTKYKGRCFKGAYILDIISILDKSACHIVKTNGSGDGYMDVCFSARVHVFSRWDILNGIEIVSQQQMLVGVYNGGEVKSKNPQAVVSVLASKAIESFTTGQIISVRVLLPQHSPMQTQASIIGSILVCDKTAPIYKLIGSLDQSSRAELAPMLAMVESELNLRSQIVKTRKADLWFFEILLYSYREITIDASKSDQTINSWNNGPIWEGPSQLHNSDTEVANILDIIRRVVDGETVSVTGYWSRSTSLYRSSPLVAFSSKQFKSREAVITDGFPRTVFPEFLKNILDYLVTTRELVSIYNTRELIEKHLNLWGIMRSAQQII